MYDVVVVGAGSAGCVLAGRLGGRVLLLEAGPAGLPDQLRRVASLAPGQPWTWAHPALLRPGLPHVVPRGRGLGGSSAINGAAWTRATPADADGWGIPGWTWDYLLPHYLAAESDPLHGTSGPIPVRRPAGALLHPASERFLVAAERLGFEREPDKNAGGRPGAGPVPTNSVNGVRIDAATAYLGPAALPAPASSPNRRASSPPDPPSSPIATPSSPIATPSSPIDHPGPPPIRRDRSATRRASSPSGPPSSPSGPPSSPPEQPSSPIRHSSPGTTPPGPTVWTDATVIRVVVHGGRAVGVELDDGTLIEAGEVVLCAGAVGTPRLLLRSGIGPAGDLRAAGVDVVQDLPGVGRDWSDHPAVFVPFADNDPPAHPHASSAQVALNLDAGADPAGDVEVLLFARPFTPGGDLHLMCALQQPDSRGVITLDTIEYRYLRTEHDRRRLRHAVRTGAELLRAGLGERTGPPGDVLGNDRTLDGWIAAHLTTSVHLCGSAAMGSVVDADLRVRGIDGLRVADTSILPTVPRRGPAATAVAIGEKAAELLRS